MTERLRRNVAVTVAYLFFGFCGVLVFFSPSVALAEQGGVIVVFAWGGCCIAGAVLGLIGIAFDRTLVELLGIGATAAASLTWAAALALQADHTGSAVPLTAACMASASAGLLLQRWLDASRSPRR